MEGQFCTECLSILSFTAVELLLQDFYRAENIDIGVKPLLGWLLRLRLRLVGIEPGRADEFI